MSVVLLFSTVIDDLHIKKQKEDRIKLFPVPADNINYIFLQSIESNTSIVIEDFSGLEKKIILIIDKYSDNTINNLFKVRQPDFNSGKAARFTDL